MSKMGLHQIFKLNYYEKLQDWWTDDVNGDCISFNFFRNPESSMIFLKSWREDYKKIVLPDLSTMFLFRKK